MAGDQGGGRKGVSSGRKQARGEKALVCKGGLFAWCQKDLGLSWLRGETSCQHPVYLDGTETRKWPLRVVLALGWIVGENGWDVGGFGETGVVHSWVGAGILSTPSKNPNVCVSVLRGPTLLLDEPVFSGCVTT